MNIFWCPLPRPPSRHEPHAAQYRPPRLASLKQALYVKEQIKPFGVKVTRIARGIPVGGDLEYTDGATLTDAIRGRQDL